MELSFVIAVDIGTTSTKTLIINQEGSIIAEHSIEYPLFTPKPDRAEQDPDEIFRAVIDAIYNVKKKAMCAKEDILCVSFSSAMHSLIAVDKHNHPLTPCITFADNRSVDYAEMLKSDGRGHQIYQRTGTPIHPMSPLLKLMWMKDHEKVIFQSAHRFIGIKEYVFFKLFQTFVIDYSIASATGLFNLEKLHWDSLALKTAGISEEQLSIPVDTTHKLIGMDQTLASEMQLSKDTPFVIGASDGVLANLGIGAMEKGIYAVTIGTSGAVRGVVNKPITDPKGRLFCYALNKDFWVIGGAINNGGIMFRWVKEQLATKEASEAMERGQNPYDYLTELAQQVSPGSDGLLFLPFLAGERAPYWNANARGTFFGLTLYHQKKHMIRSVLEGVMFRIHSVLSVLEELAGPTVEIRASGGFARSNFWSQMLADVSGTRLVIPNSIESSGLGAAKLGLLAMGEIVDLQELNHWVHIEREHEFQADHHLIYQELAMIYMRVYHQLKNEYDLISAFQQKHSK